jgi:hypothetical protein
VAPLLIKNASHNLATINLADGSNIDAKEPGNACLLLCRSKKTIIRATTRPFLMRSNFLEDGQLESDFNGDFA